MINQSTMDKLIEMRLTAMADAFRIQMDDSSMKDISFEERFGMLVDVEYTSRKNNRLKRIIRNAELEQPDACIAGIDYRSGRKLNKELIKRLATCEYICRVSEHLYYRCNRKQPEITAHLQRYFQNILNHYCLSLMNGYC